MVVVDSGFDFDFGFDYDFGFEGLVDLEWEGLDRFGLGFVALDQPFRELLVQDLEQLLMTEL